MTLFEEVYREMTELLPFYRFEGYISYPHFDISKCDSLKPSDGYVYFSASSKHHDYYVGKRLKQIITREVLKDSELDLTKSVLMDSDSFNEIVNRVRNFAFVDKPVSIECRSSAIVPELFLNNNISSRQKKANDRRIERVDSRIYGGGYGLCDAWLEVFDLLTYFHSYRRITNENLVEFLYLYRRNVLNGRVCVDPVAFLKGEDNLVVKLNPKVQSDFSKYVLMDNLQGIVEDRLYTGRSILNSDPDEEIKKIVQTYSSEREELLEKAHKVYQKKISKQ